MGENGNQPEEQMDLVIRIPVKAYEAIKAGADFRYDVFKGIAEGRLLKESENPAKHVMDKLRERRLFCGVYDAENGNEQFMYGVCTVMEEIASMVSEEYCDKFSNMFMDNMTASKEKGR